MPPVEGVSDAGKGLGQGRQVTVVHPPCIECGGELGQGCWPFRALGDCGDGHFLHNGDEPIHLDNTVDDLNGGAARRDSTREFPCPVATR
jgi:hypothetical protein